MTSKKNETEIKKKKQRGQGVMEYIIVTSLVGIFCLAAVKTFGTSVKARVNNMNRQIVEQIKL